MTRAGADIIVAHMGLTTNGAIGAQTAKTLDQSVTEVQSIIDAANQSAAMSWSFATGALSQRLTMRHTCLNVARILTGFMAQVRWNASLLKLPSLTKFENSLR